MQSQNLQTPQEMPQHLDMGAPKNVNKRRQRIKTANETSRNRAGLQMNNQYQKSQGVLL